MWSLNGPQVALKRKPWPRGIYDVTVARCVETCDCAEQCVISVLCLKEAFYYNLRKERMWICE